VSLYQTFSQGRILLTSTDPIIDPQVDQMLLSNERDLIRLRDGMRRLLEIAKHPATTEISDGGVIGRSEQNLDDFSLEDGLDEWLLWEVADGCHAIGTCRMGPVEDPRSVVDPDGRVIGVEGLRVVDASIMPEIPRANTHLSIVLVAEHIAERIHCTDA
jgi:choline dehydrogenase